MELKERAASHHTPSLQVPLAQMQQAGTAVPSLVL